MRSLTDQQRLNLVESDQVYRAWREAAWRQHEYRYKMSWKLVNDAGYLIRLNDARSNDRSRGRRSSKTEQIDERFQAGQQVANEIYRGLAERLATQQCLNRALQKGFTLWTSSNRSRR